MTTNHDRIDKMSQKRAKQGGEYGANGEWYDGGRFINTIPENPKKAGSNRRGGPRKVEVEPSKWEESREGQFPIFSIVGTQAGWVDRWDESKGIVPDENGIRFYGSTWRGWDVTELCKLYNAGQRWDDIRN